MDPRLVLVSALVATSGACRGHADPPQSGTATPSATSSTPDRPPSIYVLAPPGPKSADDEIFATNGPTFGAVEGSALKALLPASLAGAPLTAPVAGRYSASGTYKLPDGKLATLELSNTYHRGTHSESIDELNDKSPRLCAKHDTVQGQEACITRRSSADAATVIRWYLFDRLVVHLTAPTEALARELATSVPIGRIATLSAAP